MEEILQVYVDELISSSLVIAFNERGWGQSCKIHDLVHDFCSIKARKGKLFDFTNSSAPLSSSDLMPRGMTIHYDHPDENVVLFNPEKKNPYVKHLLSLKVIVEDGKDTHLSYSCHLRHLRLLKRLELRNIRLTDSLLNEIGMLFHLRCLNIWTETEALPPSFSNLCNLETLVVENWGSTMVVSPSIWSLAKLRRVSIDSCTFFDWDDDGEPKVLEEDWKLENLRILDKFRFSCLDDTTDIFKRFPNLRSFTCEISGPWDCSEEIYFPRLDVLNELEEVSAWFQCPKCSHAHQWDFHFPLSLKELDLKGFDLSSDSLSGIARLPNLQILHLRNAIIEGKEWNMEEVTFENLRSLKLESVSFSEWQVGEESVFLLEELHIRWCDELMEIPDSFGDIASLKSIYLVGNRQLVDSAIKVKQYVAEMTGEDELESAYKGSFHGAEINVVIAGMLSWLNAAGICCSCCNCCVLKLI
ncbi:putative late blight resistance protein homolog R1B-14 [Nicotiana tabacum]|uniref:Late blight resistance protein homolog R1B-14 n=1 Tax=Nicotiana tabacum TaxID=4097 RepID=A0AC58S6P3_TOBAC